MFSLSGK